MQYANHSDSEIGCAVIDHVAPYPAAAVACADVIASCSWLRTNSELSKTIRQFIRVAIGLFQPPLFERIEPDGFKVTSGFGR